jgi:tRNA(fMet)-specific endonuclease VapC
VTGYVLLDTDVFSYLWKGQSYGESFRRAIEGRRPCISFATVAQLYKGATKNRWGTAKISQLETHLEATLVVPFDIELARTCGRLLALREQHGLKMEEFDAWIAATALRHDIPLATNNRRHFEGIPGLTLVGSALE